MTQYGFKYVHGVALVAFVEINQIFQLLTFYIHKAILFFRIARRNYLCE